ncbi:DgyrCDS5165 [Dimorphilus gyrociliatus]|uniref:Large ribosomal subunit protein uL18m n=1 Tax=Dimorphilus gyrociliatus TaxID=2664684 RepID=A0A7I8VNU2_9ANNE|nr:DgyrCDS5165 [Dimorphilus gyrociliatus]
MARASKLMYTSLNLLTRRLGSQIQLVSITAGRYSTEKQATNEDLEILPDFVNRNPRCLEYQGIARKTKGWTFQYPSREFYHRLVIEKTHRNITADVEHCTGKTVVSASTLEMAIASQLESKTDLNASRYVGKILGRRCQESGITSMVLQDGPASNINVGSQRFTALIDAMKEEGVSFEEVEEVKREYEPGIDYDNEEEFNKVMKSPVKKKRHVKRITVFTPRT